VCYTLQHAATNFNTLQHTEASSKSETDSWATHYNTLQYTEACSKEEAEIRWSTMYCRTATHCVMSLIKFAPQILCDTLQNTATHCNILRHESSKVDASDAMCCSSGVAVVVLQCVAACCSVL